MHMKIILVAFVATLCLVHYSESLTVKRYGLIRRYRFGGIHRYGVHRYGWVRRYPYVRRYTYGIRRYGIRRYGIRRYGVGRFGIRRYGIHRYGIHRYRYVRYRFVRRTYPYHRIIGHKLKAAGDFDSDEGGKSELDNLPQEVQDMMREGRLEIDPDLDYDALQDFFKNSDASKGQWNRNDIEELKQRSDGDVDNYDFDEDDGDDDFFHPTNDEADFSDNVSDSDADNVSEEDEKDLF